MFDHKGWIKRAQKFVVETVPHVPHDDCSTHADIAPPLTDIQLQQLQAEVGYPLPLELQRFWLTASRHCNCRYVLETEEGVYAGGAAFTDALKLSDDLFDCREWADIVASWPDDPTLWLHSIPFFFLNNGDYLGLFMPTPQDNPPVAYLSHDDESFILAESFTAFLETWERLCYLGPESWELEAYRDANGRLNADGPQAQELRDFFAGKKPIKPAPTPSELEEYCLSHLKQMTMALVMYVIDHDQVFPRAAHWCDELETYQRHFDRVLACPAINLPIGYAMNANLSGVSENEIVHPEKTVLFFESDLNCPNPHGTAEALIARSRHSNGKIAVVFADSNAHWVSEHDCKSLKWTVD